MDKSERIIHLCILLLGFVLVLSVIPFISSSQQNPSIPNVGTINYSTDGVSWLHTSGQNVYDSSGKQVKLWGCVFQTGDQKTYTQSDMQAVKDMGFNTIRLWIYWGQVEPSGPTVTGVSHFTSAPWQIDNMVQWAANVGLYVILCPGASSTWKIPSWVPSGDITCPDGGGSWSLTDSSTLTGIANLYAFMAKRYALYNNVIFEGLNEMSGTDYTNFRTWNNNWVSAVEQNEGSNSHLKIIQFLVNYNGAAMTGYLNLHPPYVSGTHDDILMATHSYWLVKSGQSQATYNGWAAQVYSACVAVDCPWTDTEFSTAVGGTYSDLQIACQVMTQNGISGYGYFCYNAPTGNNYNSNWCINNPNNKATLLSILQPYMIQP